jgi:hypothetical protein
VRVVAFVPRGCSTEIKKLRLKEGHSLRVFEENRILRKIFGPRRDEVTGDWRRLHNEELYSYSSHQM